MSAIGAADRFAPHGLVRGQILEGDESLAALHLGDQQLGRLAPIEAVVAKLPDAFERGREVLLHEAVSGGERRAVRLREYGAASRVRLQARQLAAELSGEVVVEGEAVPRQGDGRVDDFGARELPVACVDVEEPRDRPRHADGQVRMRREPRDHVAVGVEVHVVIGAGGCALAVIVGHQRPIGQSDYHEAATADVAGGWVGDGEGESGGHRRVDSVAAAPEHAGPDLGGEGGT